MKDERLSIEEMKEKLNKLEKLNTTEPVKWKFFVRQHEIDMLKWCMGQQGGKQI